MRDSLKEPGVWPRSFFLSQFLSPDGKGTSCNCFPGGGKIRELPDLAEHLDPIGRSAWIRKFLMAAGGIFGFLSEGKWLKSIPEVFFSPLSEYI